MSKLVKSELQAVKLSLLMWRWLNENPLKHKEDFPDFYKLNFHGMQCNCACCDFFNYEYEGNSVCEKCALNICSYNGSDFSIWYDADGYKKMRKQASANIVAKLEKRLYELEHKNCFDKMNEFKEFIMRYLFTYRKKVFRYTFPSHPFIYWIGGFVKMFEGLLNIVTFGTMYFDFNQKYYTWIINNRDKYRD